MTKSRALFPAILLVLTGCAASYQNVQKSEVPLHDYGTVTVGKVSAEEFWAKNPGLKDDPKWMYQVNRASDHISTKLREYFADDWKGKGDKELRIDADMFIFDPGSRATRYLVGFGAGKGKVGYNVTLTDVSTGAVASRFEAYGTLAMGMFGGDIGTAYDQCCNAIIAYVEDSDKAKE